METPAQPSLSLHSEANCAGRAPSHKYAEHLQPLKVPPYIVLLLDNVCACWRKAGPATAADPGTEPMQTAPSTSASWPMRYLLVSFGTKSTPTKFQGKPFFLYFSAATPLSSFYSSLPFILGQAGWLHIRETASMYMHCQSVTFASTLCLPTQIVATRPLYSQHSC